MSHEQSETVQRKDGKWINVYGRNIKGKAGQQLPGTKSHDSSESAVAEARKRSEDYRPPGGAAARELKGK